VWGEKNDMVNQSSFVLWSQKTFRRWHCLMIFRVEVINIILNNISSFGLEEKALFQWGCQVCCASSKQVWGWGFLGFFPFWNPRRKIEVIFFLTWRLWKQICTLN
jgi:hypothetical protein